jgi:hypothetical protein
MPQPRGGGSRSRSTAKSASGSTRAKRTTTRSASTAKRSTTAKRATASRSAASKSTARKRPAARKAAAGSTEAQIEAVAQRLRKLNERIIDAGREAGETTLTNYEKALKAIASAVERGPGSSDIDWISNVANAQAKFIREVTSAMASAARDRLK